MTEQGERVTETLNSSLISNSPGCATSGSAGFAQEAAGGTRLTDNAGMDCVSSSQCLQHTAVASGGDGFACFGGADGRSGSFVDTEGLCEVESGSVPNVSMGLNLSP